MPCGTRAIAKPLATINKHHEEINFNSIWTFNLTYAGSPVMEFI